MQDVLLECVWNQSRCQPSLAGPRLPNHISLPQFMHNLRLIVIYSGSLNDSGKFAATFGVTVAEFCILSYPQGVGFFFRMAFEVSPVGYYLL